jgi:dTDP-4-amino-4,6-dideoxygalactose transaminase
MKRIALPAREGGRPVRPKERFLVFGQPVIGEAEIRAVVECLEGRWIGTGPRVQQFETEFARYRQTPHAVAVSSCTAALHLSLLALGIGPGDEVITTCLTFCSTVNAIIHCGAHPVLADCDRATMNISAEDIEKRITTRTKAIVVVHLYGRPCDMDAIMALAADRGLKVIEDCAHAIEATYRGKSVGDFGDLGCFSFYVTKNLTTAEGGMTITRQPGLADRIKTLALHGLSHDAWRRFSDPRHVQYEVVAPGFKYNMTDLQAALGLVQLQQIEVHAERRAEIWARYCEALADLPCVLPAEVPPHMTHARHLFTPLLQLERLRVGRDEIMDAMAAENIGAGIHYMPVSLHRYYRETYGYARGDYPNAEFIGSRTLSLPLSGGLSDDDVADVCEATSRMLRFYAR